MQINMKAAIFLKNFSCEDTEDMFLSVPLVGNI